MRLLLDYQVLLVELRGDLETDFERCSDTDKHWYVPSWAPINEPASSRRRARRILALATIEGESAWIDRQAWMAFSITTLCLSESPLVKYVQERMVKEASVRRDSWETVVPSILETRHCIKQQIRFLVI